MTADQIIDRPVDLPPRRGWISACPRSSWLEQGAPTAADRRHIQDGIEELRWFAALKPSNIGVSEYRDDGAANISKSQSLASRCVRRAKPHASPN